jgi:hypothetical protein
MLNTVKEIQIMHSVTVYLSNFVLLVPQNVSANSYDIISGIITNCIRCALNKL